LASTASNKARPSRPTCCGICRALFHAASRRTPVLGPAGVAVEPL
jgi:hypothetical protein